MKRKSSQDKYVNFKDKTIYENWELKPWWIFCGFVIVTLIHMNDDKEPVEQTEGGEGGENGQITQETLDNANVEVGHCKHWALYKSHAYSL